MSFGPDAPACATIWLALFAWAAACRGWRSFWAWAQTAASGPLAAVLVVAVDALVLVVAVGAVVLVLLDFDELPQAAIDTTTVNVNSSPTNR